MPDRDITPITIEEEMQRSYLDYAMSVIVSRALPDVRDGLKPVHRRILYAMKDGGYDWSRPFRKCARIVGDVMGKYHPHGDAAIYDALVRMAQDFSMRLPLIDGQGNFGSMDGDPPAAMRYTEARLARSTEPLIDDIDKDTVDFQPNYDESVHEPTVLPAKYPNVLVNGAGGIAVGMATNIPPHNLGEVVKACLAYIEDPEIDLDALMKIVPGPDFPTGGIILGRGGLRSAAHTGRGSIIVRGQAHIEDIAKDRKAIVITEIPYQVNKARMIERIADLVRDKTVEGIGDLRDESDRHGIRVVVEIRREAVAEVVLNQLYKFTPLQTSFGINTLALNGGRPEVMNLKEIITAFISFREEVITRRTVFELGKARERAHVLVGLAVAVANLDPIIKLIREAKDPQIAREQLMAKKWPAKDVAPLIELIDEPGRKLDGTKYQLSEVQARAILDLRLHRLTGLEREKIASDLKEIVDKIAEYLSILDSRDKLFEVMKQELIDVHDTYANERRTEISDEDFEQDIEDLIQREDMVVTVTHGGYIKRVPLSTYRAQRRGGKGRAGMQTRENDFVSQVYAVNTHTPVLFFSSRGIVYKQKVYKLPLGTPQARGKALHNLLPLEEDEYISTVMPLPEDEDSWKDLHVVFATATGNIRRNSLEDFIQVKANGKIAMKLREGDRLIGVRTCTENDDIMLSAKSGKCIRFPVTDVRVFTGRTSTGVRGIRLTKKDEVMALSILHHTDVDRDIRDSYIRAANAKRRDEKFDLSEFEIEPDQFGALESREQFLLTVTENGYGKRSSAYEYRVTGRGGSGIANIETSERNGEVVASFPVDDGDQVMMITDKGQVIRSPVADISIQSRKTQGVTLFKVDDDERVVSVAWLADVGGEDETD